MPTHLDMIVGEAFDIERRRKAMAEFDAMAADPETQAQWVEHVAKYVAEHPAHQGWGITGHTLTLDELRRAYARSIR